MQEALVVEDVAESGRWLRCLLEEAFPASRFPCAAIAVVPLNICQQTTLT